VDKTYGRLGDFAGDDSDGPLSLPLSIAMAALMSFCSKIFERNKINVSAEIREYAEVSTHTPPTRTRINMHLHPCPAAEIFSELYYTSDFSHHYQNARAAPWLSEPSDFHDADDQQ